MLCTIQDIFAHLQCRVSTLHQRFDTVFICCIPEAMDVEVLKLVDDGSVILHSSESIVLM